MYYYDDQRVIYNSGFLLAACWCHHKDLFLLIVQIILADCDDIAEAQGQEAPIDSI